MNFHSEHSRRALLKAAIAAIGLPSLITARVVDAAQKAMSTTTDTAPSQLFISGARQSADLYAAVIFDQQGKMVSTVSLPARAHGAAAHHLTHRGCLFARRPGLYINTFDIRYPEIQHVITPVPGRHFYGHGAYSRAGNLLYATENDYDEMRGIIGVYDASSAYRRVGEMASGGVGPHELIRIPGSDLLVVANGGIHTHPDSGREKLNTDSMRPSLSIVDPHEGKLVGQHYLPDALHQVSIRHLACTHNGDVWFAGQYEGTDPLVDGLAGLISIEESLNSFQHGASRKGLSLIDLPASLQMDTRHYLSSVAVTGNHAVYTSAKGSLAFKVNRKSRHVEERVSVVDCSGVAALTDSSPAGAAPLQESDAALITTGTGDIVRVDESGLTSVAVHQLQWDNHVYQLL